MKLYINNPNLKSLKDFIKTYIESGNPTTYTSDEKDVRSIQCLKGRNRSFSDLLYLAQTYFPEATDKDLAVILKDLCEQDICGWLFCDIIEKTVFFRQNEPGRYCYNWDKNCETESIDHYEEDCECEGCDGWSLRMLNRLTLNNKPKEMLKTIGAKKLLTTKVEVTRELSLRDVLPEGELILELNDGTIASYMVYEQTLKKYKSKRLYANENFGWDISFFNGIDQLRPEDFEIVKKIFEENNNYSLKKAWFMNA